jgi:predicted adenine nucleotide alpha hydrolase (AANH) superfamily ATPase
MGNTTIQKISKIDYAEYFFKEYRDIRKEYNGELPPLLLHVCCGACLCFPLLFLSKLFKITIFFSNSNIYPKEEYDRRIYAARDLTKDIEGAMNTTINFVEDDYDHDNFKKSLKPLAQEKEGGARCFLCINRRLSSLFSYAEKNSFPFVTTVMSVSRNKNAQMINVLGKGLEKQFPSVTFLIADFKKDGGQDIGVDIAKKYDIYRQSFCGCEYGLRAKR